MKDIWKKSSLHVPGSLFQSLMLVLNFVSFQTVWLFPANLLIRALLMFTTPQLKTCMESEMIISSIWYSCACNSQIFGGKKVQNKYVRWLVILVSCFWTVNYSFYICRSRKKKKKNKKRTSHDLALTLLEDAKLKITQWKNHAISWILDAVSFLWEANTFLRALNVMNKQSAVLPSSAQKYFFIFFTWQLQIVKACYVTSSSYQGGFLGKQKEACGNSQADSQTSFERITLSRKWHTDFWLVVWRMAVTL